MISRDEWVWMPHAGHLIVGHECRFHLATRVGDVVISTVGEWWPDTAVRDIHAAERGIQLEGKGDARAADFLKKCGYMEIGYDRTYETMVFGADYVDGCCPWRMVSGRELDFAGYKDADAAYTGHLAMCERWAEKDGKVATEEA